MAGLSVKMKPLEYARRKYYKAAENSPRIFQEMTNQLADVALEWARLYTPVKSGKLQEAWKIVHTGKYVNTLVNEKDYASHVNDGHWMGKDRFVPGEWQGNQFIYKRYTGKSRGMFVRNQWIDGQNFLEKTVAVVEDVEAEKYGRRIVEMIREEIK